MNEIQLYIKNPRFITSGVATGGGTGFLGGSSTYMEDTSGNFDQLLRSRLESGESITVFNTTDSTKAVITGVYYNKYITMASGSDIFDTGERYSIGSTTEWDKSELFEDETIKLKQAIKNYRDVAKILTDFSQPFSLPASKTNNKIFDHYYNGDIIGGFDARFKVDARLQINGVLFKEGVIILQSVKMKNGKPSSYEINFQGKTPSLKTLFGDDKLDDLSYLDVFDIGYGATDVKALFDAGKNVSGTSLVANTTNYPDMCCPFISAKNRYYYNSNNSTAATATVRNIKGTTIGTDGIDYKDLKPSIKVWHILKAIEAKYGFTFSDDFFDSDDELFKQLHLWCSRKSGQLLEGIDNKSDSTDFEDLTRTSALATEVRQGADLDYFNLWSYERFLGSNRYGHLVYTAAVYPLELDRLYDVKIVDKDTGEVYAEFLNQVGDTAGFVKDFAISVDDPDKVIKPTLVVTSATVTYYYATVELIERTTTSLGTGGSVIGSPTTATYTIGVITGQIELAENVGFRSKVVPKIKVIDFLTGIFKAFNLVAYFEDNVLTVKDMDTYYTTGTTNYDITQYVDASTATYKPSTVYSEINFEYKKAKTIFAIKSNEATNDEYGNERFNSEGTNTEFVGGKYDIKLPFERLLGENMVNEHDKTLSGLVWSYAVNIDEKPVLNAPALICVKKKDITSLGAYVVNPEASSTASVTKAFPVASVYFDAGASPSGFRSLNFGEEFSPSESNGVNSNTLFKEHWKTYIKNLLYNSTTRVLTVKAFLPSKILQNYRLYDKFIISGKAYIINSIDTDLKTGESKLELITDNYTIETE